MKAFTFEIGNLRELSSPITGTFSDEEEYVKQQFSSNRWDVYKLNPTAKPQNTDIPSHVWRHLEEDSGYIASKILIEGIPDFLLYDGEKGTPYRTRDFKFIEAKSGKNGLQGNQIEWINKFHMLEVEVVHLRN